MERDIIDEIEEFIKTSKEYIEMCEKKIKVQEDIIKLQEQLIEGLKGQIGILTVLAGISPEEAG